MATVVVDDSSLQANSQPKSGGLVWGSEAAWRYIHQMNRVNSRNDFMVMMIALNIFLGIIMPHPLGGALSDDAVYRLQFVFA